MSMRHQALTALARLQKIVAVIMALTVLNIGLPMVAGQSPERSPVLQDASIDPIPMMAYYYIWFDVTSWNRAKSDYPVLGRYSSDDRAIMEQHIEWAQAAGIDGFIVSWKSTFQLDSRLELLIELADAHDFRLWIIYQGLDFERNPLPIERIESDLEYFIEEYSAHPAFATYDRPVVIWSGTWEFSRDEVNAVSNRVRNRLLLLATERNLDGYNRLADLIDGNAYYWSSVNPATYPRYQEKLDEMGAAIHENGGLWIAPAAPGFDARMIGGTTVVERNDGETLRIQLNTALNSNPDAIGLISWNEFSENTHVEPSELYGSQALDVLRGRESAEIPLPLDFDSSDPGTTNVSDTYSLSVLVGLGLFMLACFAIVIYRWAVTNTKKQV